MREIWEHIERWLEVNAGDALKALRPPAALRDVEALERTIGAQLPRDFRLSLLVHDGQESGLPVFGPWELLSLRRIDHYWTLNREASSDSSRTHKVRPAGPVSAVWWSDGWVPFADDGAGNDLCFDVRPPPGGADGQIVEYLHDAPVRTVVAPSFTAWLSMVADEMEGGLYEITRLGWPYRTTD